ncbi:hypothetical protein [Longimicrobium sp.]|nr:hypothetical protein [Longimicrobium sp.]HSU13476.1 hypothetical protein [Longimicrobium sp.]
MGKLKLDVDSLAVVSWTTAPQARESERDTRTWGCSLISCVAACALGGQR